ncbi:hypothetical protein OAO58_01630, partial [bacterium]|nr:hypothetical protein [bacterium]
TVEGVVALSVFREESLGGEEGKCEKMLHKSRSGNTCFGRLSDKKSWINVGKSSFFCFRVEVAIGNFFLKRWFSGYYLTIVNRS